MAPEIVAPEALGTRLDLVVMVAYFVTVVGFGVYFGRYSTTTKDFYLGGQRFAWWVIAFSGIATTIGSYSFVKYSEAGFNYGISSSQAYMNDWFWMPILMFVWLPIIYYARIQSVPEYFERRFGRSSRIVAMIITLLYLIGYVGINLLTIGTALHTLLGWNIYTGALIAGITVTLYVFAGGQTSVIMTDLVQGMTLLIVGMGVLIAGVWYLGGFPSFWSYLPEDHRFLFSEWNKPDQFSFIGIYGQDGLANTGAFVLMNQGMVMRFLALRSVKDARKMAIFWILILYPLAAITVSSGGWIARALMESGAIDPATGSAFTTTASSAFIHAADFLCTPGVFGIVLAALMAALMSTTDTLINAVSAVFVNDVYRPYVRKAAPDRHYLRVARIASLVTAAVGFALVGIFDRFGEIYRAHGAFTAAITPPIVTAIFLGILWKRFNAAGALATMVGGSALVFVSLSPPFDAWLVGPFSFGMGPDSYSFTRALFGLTASLTLGIIVTMLTRPQRADEIVGLVNGTQLEAMRRYKGGEINRVPGKAVYLAVQPDPTIEDDGEMARVPAKVMEGMAAKEGDLAYVCDARWWFGGLRSVHVKLGPPCEDDGVHLGPQAIKRAHFKPGEPVYIEKLF